ncbi:MAG: potassium channel family protein [Thermoplasmata archaeon]
MVRFRDFVHIIEVVALLALLVVVGTLGFMILEGLSMLDALHLTIQTITTVGYGSPVIQTSEGRIFSNGLMFFGVGIVLYAFWILMDVSMGSHIRHALGQRSYKRELERMQAHVIVCGYGRVGQAAVERLMATGRDFVVICRDKEHLEPLPEGVPRIVGDATEEATLKEAGIEQAEAMLIAFGDDSDTILAIVTAKALRPVLRVIARASYKENTRKMVKVGANEVIVPELEGGRRMADHAAAV